ncbi:MAG: acyl transferase, partial [Saprospiraceae bacterium]
MTLQSFDDFAIDLFWYQYTHSIVYSDWINNLFQDGFTIDSIEDIPFMPISAFKNNVVMSGVFSAEKIFTSSGTSGSLVSSHYIKDESLYHTNSKLGFESHYGDVAKYCFLALLPSYMEREGSSLISMIEYFISLSSYDESGFYLYNHDELKEKLRICKAKNMPTILFGVSFALLDFVATHNIDFPNLIIMETGGMKGRRAEITRSTLHNQIQIGFNTQKVHSEYGMTELLSQSYSLGDGIFLPATTVKMSTKEVTDPLTTTINNTSGILNVID